LSHLTAPLTPRTTAFLLDEIQSVERLETLLLVYRRRDGWVSAHDLSNAVLLAPDAIHRQLEALATQNLLNVRVTDDVRYRFEPADAGVADMVQELDEVYRTRRDDVIAIIAERLGAMQRFADAFRLKRSDS
jgi:predicted ArsR family transcriptional regulator